MTAVARPKKVYERRTASPAAATSARVSGKQVKKTPATASTPPQLRPPAPAQPAATGPAAAPTGLFRPEALQARQTNWLGVVLLDPKLSYQAFARIAAGAIVALLAFLIFGSYTRKVRVAGLLVPELGLVTISAPQPGAVQRLFVQEGDKVKRGDPLVELSGELQNSAGALTRTQIVNRLTERRDSQSEESRLQKKVLEEDEQALRRQVDPSRCRTGTSRTRSGFSGRGSTLRSAPPRACGKCARAT